VTTVTKFNKDLENLTIGWISYEITRDLRGKSHKNMAGRFSTAPKFNSDYEN
jgi:hypothetical protein